MVSKFDILKVSGKLVWVTALFPYVILLILGIRAWIMEGASNGIKFYIYPDFSRLKDYTVWVDAANQIVFTLSVSYGGLLTLASYNPFHQNVMRYGYKIMIYLKWFILILYV